MEIMTSDLLSEKEIDREVSHLSKEIYWSSGREIVGSLFHFLSGGVDGVVFLTSFKCGIDALLQEFIKRRLKVRGGSSIPLLILSFDEHTGREGLTTRLEAFRDVVEEQKRIRVKSRDPNSKDESKTFQIPVCIATLGQEPSPLVGSGGSMRGISLSMRASDFAPSNWSATNSLGFHMGNYLGIDVGSITTKLVVLSESDQVLAKSYIRNIGRPIEAIQQGMEEILSQLGETISIDGVATTGSARHLAAYLVGADLIKNEITAHAISVIDFLPEAKTIIEIGGQDSKVIVLRNGVVVDFAMNTVCAAGTGSFLDQQAARLGISIEAFGDLALQAHHPVRIAGRCTVFAETDMIHKQQMGHSVEDIVAGLCDSLVKNYLNNVCRGKGNTLSHRLPGRRRGESRYSKSARKGIGSLSGHPERF